MAARVGQSGPEELEALAGKTRDCGVVVRWEEERAGENEDLSSTHEVGASFCLPGLAQESSCDTRRLRGDEICTQAYSRVSRAGAHAVPNGVFAGNW